MNDPILSLICTERGVAVEHKVYQLTLTRENLQKLWQASSKYPVLLNQEIRGDFEKFVSIFLEQDSDTVHARGIIYVVDDFVGVFFLTNIDVFNQSAEAHFTFFDGRIHGRDKLAKAMCKFAFEHFKFNRLFVAIPAYVPSHTFAFAKRVGFVTEGKFKGAAKKGDKFFDVTVLGMLSSSLSMDTQETSESEDTSQWEHKSEQSVETVEQNS